MTDFSKPINPSEYWNEVARIKQIRSQPDYVPEFPPSNLIDDSPEGTVYGMYKTMRVIKNERTD